MVGVTVLGSGSAGNSIIIQGEDRALLIDVGFSMKKTREKLATAGVDVSGISAILISHEHSDHVKGLRVAAKQLGVPVYCNRSTAMVMKNRETAPAKLNLFSTGSTFTDGEFTVTPFPIPHDAMDPVGFIIQTGQHKIGIATDVGHVSNPVAYHLRECDILIIESNHDLELLKQSSRPWSLKQRIMGRHGHLSNNASGELLKKIVHDRTRHLVLAHASEDCNRPQIIETSAKNTLKESGRQDIETWIATQSDPLPSLWVDS